MIGRERKTMNQAQKILQIAQKYNNSDDLLMSMFGISSDDPMDLYVIAPSWTPEKILKNYEYEVEPKFKLRRMPEENKNTDKDRVKLALKKGGECRDLALHRGNCGCSLVHHSSDASISFS